MNSTGRFSYDMGFHECDKVSERIQTTSGKGPWQTGCGACPELIARKLLSRCRSLKEPVVGPVGEEKKMWGKMGPKGRKIWRTESCTRLQTANLGKGQWVAAGFMGAATSAEILIRSALSRKELKNSCGGDFEAADAFGFRCIREPGCGHHPAGLRGLSMLRFDRTSPGRVQMMKSITRNQRTMIKTLPPHDCETPPCSPCFNHSLDSAHLRGCRPDCEPRRIGRTLSRTRYSHNR